MDAAGAFYLVLLNTGVIEARFRNSDATAFTCETTSWTPGEDLHLVLTYDGANLKLYKNGALSETVAASGNLPANLPIMVGVQTEALPAFPVDDCRVYNRPLTDAEVAAIYALGV